jgi:LPS-assembly lipoprotein
MGGGRKFLLPLTSYLLPLLLLSCGFQLRGDVGVDLKSITVTQVGGSQVAAEIRRTLSTGRTKLVNPPMEAEAHLRILRELREKSIYTLTGAGRVYEYQLRLAVQYQLTVPKVDEPVIAPVEIEARRLITYVEAAPIAKDAEEELLYKDMQADLARQILRHVAAVKREM